YCQKLSACGAASETSPSVSYYSPYSYIGKIRRFSARSVRTNFYVREVEIPLPRTDRLAAMPLPNPFLRRAVPALSKTIFIA
ncbi:hypothetical protein OV515_24995, partial [Salmonella enterica subsp. enterica serovar 1,4,[5],12:i:-]|nr:hypothetical protein [Salmonella enterica subsp. enterica serovar 1,4,[5],12:i:-]